MDQNTENLFYQLCKKFDQNQDGLLNKQEIKSISQELKQELSEKEITNVIQILCKLTRKSNYFYDIIFIHLITIFYLLYQIYNNLPLQNEEISYNVYAQWWYFAKIINIEELVYFKFKIVKQLGQINEELQNKLVQNIDSRSKKINKLQFALQFGPFETISKFNLQITFGQIPQQKFEADDQEQNKDKKQQDKELILTQQIISEMQISELTQYIAFKVKCNNPNGKLYFIKYFTNLFDQLDNIGEGGQQLKNNFQYKIYTLTSSYIIVVIIFNHPLINQMFSELIELSDSLLGPEILSKLKLKIKLGQSLSYLLSKIGASSWLDQLIENGFHLKITALLPEFLQNITKDIFFNKVQKIKQSMEQSQKVQELKQLILLFMLKSSQLKLNFQKIKNFSEYFRDKEGEQKAKQIKAQQERMMNQLSKEQKELEFQQQKKNQNDNEINKSYYTFRNLIHDLPQLRSFIDLLSESCICDFAFKFHIPKINIDIQGFDPRGTSKIIDYFLLIN